MLPIGIQSMKEIPFVVDYSAVLYNAQMLVLRFTECTSKGDMQTPTLVSQNSKGLVGVLLVG